jgi:nucleoside-diphosphate-sugar epimerase
MDIILDSTRKALEVCPAAYFINASSYGAEFIDDSPQGAYNVAKRCMEVYLKHSTDSWLNYRIPSVYGPGAPRDSFIQRCVDGTAHKPIEPNKPHYIAHIDDVVDSLASYKSLLVEKITLGEIYEQFTSGRRGIHRSTPSA